MFGTANAFGQIGFQQKYQTGHGTYVFGDTITIKETELFTNYKSEFGLGNNDEMKATLNSVLEDASKILNYEN